MDEFWFFAVLGGLGLIAIVLIAIWLGILIKLMRGGV